MMAETQSSNTERFPTFAEWIGVDIHDADIDRSIIRRQARDLLDRARAISHSWEQFARPSNSSNSGSEWLDYRESARLLNEAIALLERIAGEKRQWPR